jgi:hypothetical protein
MLRKEVKRILSACLVFIMFISMFSTNAMVTSEFRSAERCAGNKINSRLLEIMDTSDRGDKIPVAIWLTDIDQEAVEQQTERTIGFTADDVMVINEDLSDELSTRMMNLLNDDVVDATFERDFNAFLQRTAEARELERVRIDEYVQTRREISRDKYIAANDTFVSSARISDEDLIFRSQFSPMVIAELTVAAIRRTAELSNVLKLEKYETVIMDELMHISDVVAREDYRINLAKMQLGIDGTGVRVGVQENGTIGLTNLEFLPHPQSGNVNRFTTDGIRPDDSHANLVTTILAGNSGIASGATVYSAGHNFHYYESIEWMIGKGVSIINYSLGDGRSTPADGNESVITAWFNHIVSVHHVTFVAAAGNAGGRGRFLDDVKIAENVITVSGFSSSTVGYYQMLPFIFEHGENNTFKPDIVAQSNIGSGSPGTSQSAPFVAGVIALMMQLRPSLKAQPHAVKAIIMASSHVKAESNQTNNAACRGGTIAPPISSTLGNFRNGNVTGISDRANLEVNILNLIAGTCVRANDIHGIEVSTHIGGRPPFPAAENRQAYIDVRINNGGWVASPRFHASSTPNPSRICAIMEHGYPASNGGRTQKQTLRYMNMYGSGDASNKIPLTPFTFSPTPSRFDVRVRPNDLHRSQVTEIVLFDSNGLSLGKAVYNSNGNVWNQFECNCREFMHHGLTEKQGAGIMNPYVALSIAAANNYAVGTINSNETHPVNFWRTKGSSEGLNFSLAWLRETSTTSAVDVPCSLSPCSGQCIIHAGERQDLDLSLHLSTPSGMTSIGSSDKKISSTEMVYFNNGNSNWEWWGSPFSTFRADIQRVTSSPQPVRYAYAWSANDRNIMPDIVTIRGVQYNAATTTNLDFGSLGFTDADIEPLRFMPNLETLYLHNNLITDIAPLSGLTYLKQLSLNENQISDISPLADLTNLMELNLSDNQIVQLWLEDMRKLQKLYLANNQISDISVLNGLNGLRELDLSYNQISNITPLEGLNLQKLYLSHNYINSPQALEQMYSLQTLDLSNNQIYLFYVYLYGLGHLRLLYIDNSKISPFDLAQLRSSLPGATIVLV